MVHSPIIQHPITAILKNNSLLPFCQNPGIALSEVITSIEVEIEQQGVYDEVYQKHYQDQLRYLHAPNDLIENLHVTRLET